MNLQNVRGFKSFLPEEAIVRNKLKTIMEKTFQKYGFTPMQTPIIYYEDFLTFKYGGGEEIVHEIFKLSDRAERELALRYDLTMPLSKEMAANPTTKKPFKRYEIGQVFRNGPIRSGRLREFTQCDVDIVGTSSLFSESEILCMVLDVFDAIGLDIEIEVNNRKLIYGILKYASVEESMMNTVILSLDKLVKFGEDSVREELKEKGLDNSSIDKIFTILNNEQGNSYDFYAQIDEENIQEGISEVEKVLDFVDDERVIFNPTLARGLEIYTGTVYEVFLKDRRKFDSALGAGGRYDSIIEKLIGNDRYKDLNFESVGFSFGLDAIFTVIDEESFSDDDDVQTCLIASINEDKSAFELLKTLRDRNKKVEISYDMRLRRVLRDANRDNIPYVIIVGSDEVKSGKYMLRDMSSGEGELLTVDEILMRL